MKFEHLNALNEFICFELDDCVLDLDYGEERSTRKTGQRGLLYVMRSAATVHRCFAPKLKALDITRSARNTVASLAMLDGSTKPFLTRFCRFADKCLRYCLHTLACTGAHCRNAFQDLFTYTCVVFFRTIIRNP